MLFIRDNSNAKMVCLFPLYLFICCDNFKCCQHLVKVAIKSLTFTSDLFPKLLHIFITPNIIHATRCR